MACLVVLEERRLALEEDPEEQEVLSPALVVIQEEQEVLSPALVVDLAEQVVLSPALAVDLVVLVACFG